MEYERGMVVRSVAGRDKGYLLCVIGETRDCVLVCDGKERKLQKPKRKNKKHIQSVAFTLPEGTLRGNKRLRKTLNRLAQNPTHLLERGSECPRTT
ncbi:MAG: KOW domain-containing RNA-binding protein [Oscillospiraceae bacterium]|jgi:ribosomal protein L14E/L6E/L27E|nr:KOW domain-containing RNA-binding protein [Oscillospiraceae bacterium]